MPKACPGWQNYLRKKVTNGEAGVIGGLFGSVQIEALMEEADWEVGNIYSNFCPFN